jgi:TetR/AcrR family transcriptional repressor of bet genes
MTEKTATSTRVTARDISKDHNRVKLIMAAAEVIAANGISGTTTAKIQELSGLSKGMINLHFQSKENLLLAVAVHLADEYIQHWRAAIEPETEQPAARLRSLIGADFSPQVLNNRNMAIWFAFRADVRAHPEYHPFIDSRSTDFRSEMTKICGALIEDGKYDLKITRVVDAFTALLEGTWTDFHLNPDKFDPIEAEQTCLSVARSFFPKHFQSTVT